MMVTPILSQSRGPAPFARNEPRFGCAQFAHIVNQPYRNEDRFIRQCLISGQNAFREQSSLNQDGWGIATYTQASHPGIFKSPLQAKSDPQYTQRAQEAAALKPLVTLAHIRMGSPVQVSNNHPFPIGRAIMMHNGFIPGKLETTLRHQLAKFNQLYKIPSLEGTTDTEVFTRHFQGKLIRDFGTGDPTRIPTKLLAQRFNESVSALINSSRNLPDNGPMKMGYNFTLVDDHRIMASRHGRTLYLGIREDRTAKKHALFSSKQEHPRLKEAIIATRPMQIKPGFLPFFRQKAIHWMEIPTDHLITIERVPKQQGTTLNIQLQKLDIDG